MLNIEQNVREFPVGSPGKLPGELVGSGEPLLFRGLVRHWPVVRAAEDSHAAVDAYLRRFYVDALVKAGYEGYINWEFCHPAKKDGRFAGIEYVHDQTRMALEYLQGLRAAATG